MKYLRLIPALLLGTMLVACNTTKKLYEAQEYDQVIQRVAPDICDGNMNAKRINMVAASYHKANQADHERIQALKASGQPDVWPEIYQRYCSMKGRNEALSCFPNKVKKGINYVPLDLDDDLTAARNHAEAFLVAKANQLLNSGSKTEAEEADKYIEQLARTNPDNSSLMNLRKKQMLITSEDIVFGYRGYGNLPMSLRHEFEDCVFRNFEEGELPYANKGTTVNHDMRPSQARREQVRVVIDDIKASPNRLDEVTFKETKGDRTVEVTDHSQNKNVTVSGSIQYIDCGKVYGFVPFEVTSTFKNDYTTIKGDREACSAETLERLNSKPVPVPTDESMLLDAAKKLNDLIAAELRK